MTTKLMLADITASPGTTPSTTAAAAVEGNAP
jgi:hypothetical protein